jgi:hypothetical protein
VGPQFVFPSNYKKQFQETKIVNDNFRFHTN